MTALRKLIPLLALVTLITIPPGILLLAPAPALADCGGDASSCKACHEGQAQMPVNQIGLWHTQHSFSDFCANCHAGDIAAKEKDAAHTGMRIPVLADPKASCEACHADNYQTLAASYQEKDPPDAAPAASQLPPPGSRNTLFIVLNAVVALGLAGLIWAVEKGPLARLARPKPDLAPMAGGAALSWNPMARKRWSPYWAGALLGVVAIFGLWLSQQPLGSSGAFLTTASALLSATGSSLSEGIYFSKIMPPKVTWQLLLVAGVVLGALVSAVWSGDFRLESVPERWVSIFGDKKWKRWLAMFAGGMILEFGASIAGGCTSGLAIAGSLQLSAAGFLFIGALFATGIITAKLLYRRNY